MKCKGLIQSHKADKGKSRTHVSGACTLCSRPAAYCLVCHLDSVKGEGGTSVRYSLCHTGLWHVCGSFP